MDLRWRIGWGSGGIWRWGWRILWARGIVLVSGTCRTPTGWGWAVNWGGWWIVGSALFFVVLWAGRRERGARRAVLWWRWRERWTCRRKRRWGGRVLRTCGGYEAWWCWAVSWRRWGERWWSGRMSRRCKSRTADSHRWWRWRVAGGCWRISWAGWGSAEWGRWRIS